MDYKAVLLKTLGQWNPTHSDLKIKDAYFSWYCVYNEVYRFGFWIPSDEPGALEKAQAQLKDLVAYHDANPDDIPMGAIYVFCMEATNKPKAILDYADIDYLEFLIVDEHGNYCIYGSDGGGVLYYDVKLEDSCEIADSPGFRLAVLQHQLFGGQSKIEP